MNNCRSCGADIIWARSTKDCRWMPLDAVRVSRGVRFVVSENGIAYLEKVGVGNESHFATCPNAKEHRKPEQGELL